MKRVYLVVEDEPGIIYLFRRHAERQRNPVNMFIATTLEQANEIFQQEKSRLTHIFLDGILTDGKSESFAQKIVGDQDFSGIIVAMSTDVDIQKNLHDILGDKYRRHQIHSDNSVPKLEALKIAFPPQTPQSQQAANPA